MHEGLNVVENWNSANDFIFYGKSGEIATNRLDDQEIAVLSLHLLQAALVYINTLMLQQVLAEPSWLARMTPEDLQNLRQRLEAEGILFKIRVLGSTVRNQEDSAPDAASAGRQKL